MNLATNLFIAYLIYFVSTYFKIFTNKEIRITHKSKQQRLDELRLLPIKTKEEQKEFIDLKYPKKDPFKWTIKNVLQVIFKIIFMIIVFIFVRFLWKTFIIFELALWQLLLFMVFVPIILNKFLKKYNLHHDDISVFFGGKKK
jgi:hypothetical protein